MNTNNDTLMKAIRWIDHSSNAQIICRSSPIENFDALDSLVQSVHCDAIGSSPIHNPFDCI